MNLILVFGGTTLPYILWFYEEWSDTIYYICLKSISRKKITRKVLVGFVTISYPFCISRMGPVSLLLRDGALKKYIV